MSRVWRNEIRILVDDREEAEREKEEEETDGRQWNLAFRLREREREGERERERESTKCRTRPLKERQKYIVSHLRASVPAIFRFFIAPRLFMLCILGCVNLKSHTGNANNPRVRLSPLSLHPRVRFFFIRSFLPGFSLIYTENVGPRVHESLSPVDVVGKGCCDHPIPVIREIHIQRIWNHIRVIVKFDQANDRLNFPG